MSVPTSTSGVNIFGMQFSTLSILALSVAGLVLLITILVLVSLHFGPVRAKRRKELKRFKADEAQAQHIATAPPTMQRPQESWQLQPQPQSPHTAMTPAPFVAHADTPSREAVSPGAVPPGVQEVRLQNTQTEPLPPTTVAHTVPSPLQPETPYEQAQEFASSV